MRSLPNASWWQLSRTAIEPRSAHAPVLAGLATAAGSATTQAQILNQTTSNASFDVQPAYRHSSPPNFSLGQCRPSADSSHFVSTVDVAAIDRQVREK